MVVLLSVLSFACWQTDWPSGVVHGTAVAGVVTVDGKPWRSAVLELHSVAPNAAITVTPFSDAPVLQTVKTDARGGFDLGGQKPGHYVILVGKPSYEIIRVELIKPAPGLRAEQLEVRITGDSCVQIAAAPIPL